MWSFHSLVHTEELTPDRELSPCMSSSLLSCLATWYPVLTKNSPFFVCNQNIGLGVWRRLSGIRLIASASTLWNIKSINWRSQVLFYQSISLHTCHCHSSSAGGWSTILVEWFKIHLSFITRILDHLPPSNNILSSELVELPLCSSTHRSCLVCPLPPKSCTPKKILFFETPIKQWILFFVVTSSLAHCQIEASDIPKPHASFLLRLRKQIPTLPMDLPLITHLSPPKPCTNSIQFLANLHK